MLVWVFLNLAVLLEDDCQCSVLVPVLVTKCPGLVWVLFNEIVSLVLFLISSGSGHDLVFDGSTIMHLPS